MNIIHNQYRQYSGKLGKAITTLDELAELAERKGSVAVKSGNNSFSVLPAKSLLYRQAFYTHQMLKAGELYEYIKPEKIQKVSQKWCKSRKETKQDKINSAIKYCLSCMEYDNDTGEEPSPLMFQLIYILDKDIWNHIGEYKYLLLDTEDRKAILAKVSALFEEKKLGYMKHPIVKKEDENEN